MTAPSRNGPPTTAMDPPPFTPPSATVGTPGEPTGLAVASGYEQARRMALELVEGIRTGDAARLARLLDDRVARALPFVVAVDRSRDQVVAALVNEARRRGLDTAPSVSELVIVDRLEVAPLAAHLEGVLPPEGLRVTDLVVQLPMADAGRRFLRRILPGWVEVGRVIVRVGPSPRIVGL